MFYSTEVKTVSILLVGYGFMGKTHASVYEELPGVEIVGVVDDQIEGREVELSSGRRVALYSKLDQALASVDCDAVDLCVPTDLHLSLGLIALSAKKHLFCEKPISLTLSEARRLEEARLEAGVQAMVGHCIRFWPEYEFLKELVWSKKWGDLKSLSMRRYAGRPGGSVQSWVHDEKRCMGAALDLHIHDTDFIFSILGVPYLVHSKGVREASGWNWIATDYSYERIVVRAEGGWNLPSNWNFEMSYRAVFAGGIVDYSNRNTPSLMLIPQKGYAALEIPKGEGGESTSGKNNLAGLSGYVRTLSYFIDQLQKNEPIEISTLTDATESLRVTLAEIQSAQENRTISLH